MASDGYLDAYRHWLYTFLYPEMLRMLTVDEEIPKDTVSKLEADLRKFFLSIESKVEDLTKTLRLTSYYCLRRQCGRWKVEYNTDEVREISDKAFDDWASSLWEIWGPLRIPTDGAYEKSILERLESKRHFNTSFPEGLEDLIPSVSETQTYITRLMWPKRFQKYLKENNIPLLPRFQF